MSERVAVVTGANRGIGLHLVDQLHHRGWRVVAGCRHPEDAGMLYALRPMALLRLDVSDAASVRHFADEVRHHTEHLDLVVNNAGVMTAAGGQVGEQTPAFAAANGPLGSLEADAIDRVLRVNAVGPLLVTQALAPLLRPGAAVINVSSRLGSITLGAASTYAYSMSKAALNMATTILARELGPHGVVCVAMSPGWVRTDMGGEHARLDPVDATSAMADLIARLRPADNGTFLDHLGEPIPW